MHIVRRLVIRTIITAIICAPNVSLLFAEDVNVFEVQQSTDEIQDMAVLDEECFASVMVDIETEGAATVASLKAPSRIMTFLRRVGTAVLIKFYDLRDQFLDYLRTLRSRTIAMITTYRQRIPFIAPQQEEPSIVYYEPGTRIRSI